MVLYLTRFIFPHYQRMRQSLIPLCVEMLVVNAQRAKRGGLVFAVNSESTNAYSRAISKGFLHKTFCDNGEGHLCFVSDFENLTYGIEVVNEVPDGSVGAEEQTYGYVDEVTSMQVLEQRSVTINRLHYLACEDEAVANFRSAGAEGGHVEDFGIVQGNDLCHRANRRFKRSRAL